MNTDISAIVNDITAGKLDDSEQLIYAAFKARNRAKREAAKLVNQAMIDEGDTVKITARMTPRVLTGLTGVVTKKDGAKVTITTPKPFLLRKVMQSVVTIPIDCVTIIAKKSVENAA